MTFVVLACNLLGSGVMDMSVSSLHEERAYKQSDICTTGSANISCTSVSVIASWLLAKTYSMEAH